MAEAALMWAKSWFAVEGEWNKTSKPASSILQPAQLTQMIHPMREGLDVTVKHRAGAPPTQFVPGAMNVQPFAAVSLPRQMVSRTTGIENFRTTPGNRTETVLAQKLQHFLESGDEDAPSKVTHFDSGESLDSSLDRAPRSSRNKSRYQSFQRRMQPANHMHSVIPRGRASLTTRMISSIAYSKAWDRASWQRRRRTDTKERRYWSS